MSTSESAVVGFTLFSSAFCHSRKTPLKLFSLAEKEVKKSCVWEGKGREGANRNTNH